MPLTFDPEKDERNRRRRGLSFDEVRRFAWRKAILGLSRVQNFDTATRFFAIGHIDAALHTVIFTFESNGIRVISLRRSSRREQDLWRQNQTPI